MIPYIIILAGFMSQDMVSIYLRRLSLQDPFCNAYLQCHKPQQSEPSAKLIFHLAPMQGYTNRHFRYLSRLMSDKVTLWTEMQKLEDLIDDGAAVRRLQYEEVEHPLVLQLGGSDYNALSLAVKKSNTYNYDEINLNIGCPSVETGGANFGAALMLQPELVHNLLSHMASLTYTPVSIKCRIAAYDSLVESSSGPSDDYYLLQNFIQTISKSDYFSHLVIHARSAVLSGLSPLKNRVVPPLKYDYVYRISQEFPRLQVTLNGGVSHESIIQKVYSDASLAAQAGPKLKSTSFVGGESRGTAAESDGNHVRPPPPTSTDTATTTAHSVNLHGIMAGRWFLSRPLDLWNIDSNPLLTHSPYTTKAKRLLQRTASTRAEAILQYGRYAYREVQRDGDELGAVLQPLLLVLEQLHDEHEFFLNGDESPKDPNGMQKYVDSKNFLEESESDDVFQALVQALVVIFANRSSDSGKLDLVELYSSTSTISSYRKLKNIISQKMGKKVVNKIQKNRNEAK